MFTTFFTTFFTSVQRGECDRQGTPKPLAAPVRLPAQLAAPGPLAPGLPGIQVTPLMFRGCLRGSISFYNNSVRYDVQTI